MNDFMNHVRSQVKEDRELARLVKQEELILEVTELALKKMEEKGLNKSDLAEMLGTTKSHVTQLLRGSRNMTLRTVSDIFFNLDCEIAIKTVADEERDGDVVMMGADLLPREDELPVWWITWGQPEVCAYPKVKGIAA
jgi:antitoxin component HigA of HigAB toxin-antitoxin module